MIPTIKVKSGDSYAIINESDFDPKKHEKYDADPITRESIATMRKGDVRDLLEAHGVDPKGTVADMRKALIRIMFMDV